MKIRRWCFIVGASVLLIGIIIFFAIKFNQKDDNHNGESVWILNMSAVLNSESISLKKGDKLNINIYDSSINSELFKDFYVENIELKEVKDNKYELWIPNDYISLSESIQYNPSVTFKISKSNDSKGTFKINKDIYHLLNEKYSIQEDSKKNN